MKKQIKCCFLHMHLGHFYIFLSYLNGKISLIDYTCSAKLNKITLDKIEMDFFPPPCAAETGDISQPACDQMHPIPAPQIITFRFFEHNIIPIILAPYCAIFALYSRYICPMFALSAYRSQAVAQF